MPKCWRRTFIGMVLSLFAVCVHASADPLAVFEEREITGRDWARTMVTYRLVGPAEQSGESEPETGAVVRLTEAVAPDQVHLVDSEGAPVPFQLWRVQTTDDGEIESARLSFYASLSSGGRYRYELVAGAAPSVEKGKNLKVEDSDDALTLQNEQVAVQLPSAGEYQFDTPLRTGDIRRHAEISENSELLISWGKVGLMFVL